MNRQARPAVVAALILCCAVGLARAQSPAGEAAPVSKPMERLKALAGEWVSAEDSEMVKKGDLVARYAVTAAGSAVVETVFPGTPHEMVTVYHADGPDVVLTHFCVDHNQPRMRASAPQGSRFEFAFDGGTNIDPKRDRHMNSASVEIVGADEIRSVWTELANGQTVFVAKTHLVRKR